MTGPTDPRQPGDPADEALAAALAAGDEQLLDYVRTHADPTRALNAMLSMTDENASQPTPADPAELISQRIQTRGLVDVLSHALASLDALIRISSLISALRRNHRRYAVSSARRLARSLVRSPFHGSALDLVRALDDTPDIDLALDLARNLDLDLGRDIADAVGLAHGLDPGHTLGHARELARDLDRGFAHKLAVLLTHAQNLAFDRDRVLAAEEVVASGADLSDLAISDLDVLVGVVWDHDTRWASGIRELVAARSREISPGVYRVGPTGNERDPHEMLSS